MSSLRFKQPLIIKGLSAEATNEWKGLHVGLASVFPLMIGTIEAEDERIWDDDAKTYRFDGPFPHDPTVHGRKLFHEYMWISRWSLEQACKYSQPKRPHILAWLESEEGKRFEYFRVSESIAEYLP